MTALVQPQPTTPGGRAAKRWLAQHAEATVNVISGSSLGDHVSYAGLMILLKRSMPL